MGGINESVRKESLDFLLLFFLTLAEKKSSGFGPKAQPSRHPELRFVFYLG